MKILFPVLILVIVSCSNMKELPKEQHYPFLYFFKESFENDTLSFYLKNPVKSPVNIRLRNDTLNPTLSEIFGRVTLGSLQDSIIKIHYPVFDDSQKFRYIVNYGDYDKPIQKNTLAFPFPKGRSYKIIQGYDGKYSHNSTSSKYAIDFSLQIGDTIASADDGFVVGVIEDYKEYGTSKAWRKNDKSNYLTIYHPHSGLFTQYVHLDHKGALVELGDFVNKGQPIAISGMTGFTNIPHLHFNVKKATIENGLVSTEINFDNNIKGESLKKRDEVKNP